MTALHRMTHQRGVILEEVQKSRNHPTADQIYERVKKRLPHVSMGTVYRNLDVLASSGLIRKLGPDFHQMRFDGDTHDHYHITCIRCGCVEDIPLESQDDPFSRLDETLGKLTKYGVFGHKLEFIGLCAECREKQGDILEEFPDGCMKEEQEYGHEGE